MKNLDTKNLIMMILRKELDREATEDLDLEVAHQKITEGIDHEAIHHDSEYNFV